MRTYTRKINYYETDKMGFVHHSNYIRYFEEARIWYMEQMGYPYERLEAENIIIPVVSVSCKYHRACRFGETVNVCVRLTQMSRVKTAFSYEVTEAVSGELRASGTSEHCYIDENGKLISAAQSAPAFYEACLKEVDPE